MTDDSGNTAGIRGLRGKMLWSLVFGAVVILALGVAADLPRLTNTLVGFRWTVLPAVIGLTLVNYSLRFVKWQMFLRTLGVTGLPWSRSALIFVSGMAMTVTPGKVGEWLKSFLLREATGTPVSKSAPVVLAERLSDGLAMALLASGGLILYGYGWQILAATAIAGLVVAAVSQYRPLTGAVIGWLRRVPFFARRLHQVEAFVESARTILHWRVLGAAILLGVVSWAAEGVAFYLVLTALGLQASPVLLVQAVFVLSASSIAGAISMLPGGLAVAEGSIAGLLLLLRATDDPATAAAATIIIRFATLWFGVALGIVALSMAGRAGESARSWPEAEAESLG